MNTRMGAGADLSLVIPRVTDPVSFAHSTPVTRSLAAAHNIQSVSPGNRLSAARVTLREAPQGGVQGLTAGIYGVVEYKNARKPEKPGTTLHTYV